MSKQRRGGDDNWEQSPEWHRYKAHVRRSLIPMIRNSAVSISIVPHDSEPDVKFAIELGLCIMMGKPILLFARSEDDIPPKLRLVADEIIISDGIPTSGAEADYIAGRIAAFVEKYEGEDDSTDH